MTPPEATIKNERHRNRHYRDTDNDGDEGEGNERGFRRAGRARGETGTGRCAFVYVLQTYYYFSSSVTFLQISQSFRNLIERVSPVDNRRHLPRLHKVAQ